MDLNLARLVIRNRQSSYADVLEAASVITSDATATVDDLVACIGQGGMAKELALLVLESRFPGHRTIPAMREALPKEEAEKLKKALEAAGATVELK